MAKYYVTVGDSMTQATTTFAAVQTQPDGGTLTSVKVPPGMTKISEIATLINHDVISVIDTGNNFTLQLSGTGLKDGIQEIPVGALMASEVGTSTTGNFAVAPALYRKVDIALKPGEITLSAAYDGTDPGTPFLGVTLGFD